MKRILIICITLVCFSCSEKRKLSHSFFLAGHSYGSTIEKSKNENLKGLHPPLMDKAEFLREQPKMTKGFLLGDCVWKVSHWPQAQEDIERIGIPIEVVRGNHDGGLKKFEGLFGPSYKKYVFKNNLYIILDSNLDGWSIEGDQLVFLMNTLRNDSRNVDNVFIFSHHLLWYNTDQFSKPFPNSVHKRKEPSNFWTKIEPLLRLQDRPVYIFAGDLGAFSMEKRNKDHIIEYFYHSYDNLTFVGTGMGGGVRDNLVIVDVYNDGSVEFRLIHLNGDDIEGLGKLEDYRNPNFIE